MAMPITGKSPLIIQLSKVLHEPMTFSPSQCYAHPTYEWQMSFIIIIIIIIQYEISLSHIIIIFLTGLSHVINCDYILIINL
jgi:hypothetical protein